MALKQQNPKLEVLAAIGGADEQFTNAFASLSNSSENRAFFVNNVVDFVEKHSLSGIDIDWEFPTSDDTNNFISLLQEIRTAFRFTRNILTVAVAPDKWRADISYDIPKIARSVNFINLMTYDFHGKWDEYVGHHAQLFPSALQSPYVKELNCASSVTYWLSKGAPAYKLNLGIPTYGNVFILQNQKEHRIGSQTNISETKETRGNMGYDEYCDVKKNGWKQQFDNNFRVYYAVNSHSWVGFDSWQQIRRKAKYVKDLKLGGVMFWSIDTDDYRNACGHGKFPLISTAFTELSIL